MSPKFCSTKRAAAHQGCSDREGPREPEFAEWQIYVKPSLTAGTYEEQKGDVKQICNLDSLPELLKEIILNYLQMAGEILPLFKFG